MRRAVVWAAALVLAGAGVLALRAEVMTVNTRLPDGSRTQFVAHAQTREQPRHLEELTRGLVSVCRLLVEADLVQSSYVLADDGTFAFSVSPGLDEFSTREMRGCLQDTRVQHLYVQVRSVETVLPRA